jgi:hypothetical protein
MLYFQGEGERKEKKRNIALESQEHREKDEQSRALRAK